MKALRQLRQSELLRHNTIFFVGTFCIALFNYIYYPIISRIVSVADFGEIQAVISLFMQLGIILTAFGYVITNIIANTKNHAESNNLILRLEHMMLIISIAVFIFLLGLSFIFQNSFKLHSIVPVLLVGILIVVNVPATSRSYILQGFRDLKGVSIGGVVFAVGKLLCTVLFIYIVTHSATAAMLGYIVAQIAMLLYLSKKIGNRYVKIQQSFTVTHYKKLNTALRQLIRKELIYGLVITAILSGLALLYTSDTIIARLFFDVHTLGLYSGVSSVARIVFFITASVSGVLIATVRMDADEKHNISILMKSVMMIMLVGGGVALFFILFPNFSISLLVGKAYTSAAGWLPLIAGVMLICSLNNLLAIYQIALRKYWTIIPVASGVLTLAIGIMLYHNNIIQLIWIYLISNAVIFVLLSIQILFERKGKV